MSELNATAQNRVTTINQYLHEIEEGFEGRGSLKRHPDGMDSKLKNILWAIDRLRAEAPGHPISDELARKAEETQARVAEFRAALSAPALSEVAKSRVERVDQRVASIEEAMAAGSRHIEGMEIDLKNARWSLDRLREEAKDHPVVGQVERKLDAVDKRIRDYAAAPVAAPAPVSTPAAPPPPTPAQPAPRHKAPVEAAAAHPAVEMAAEPAAGRAVAGPEFRGSFPSSVDLISASIPRYGLALAWDRSRPAHKYYLLALNAWMGSFDVRSALQGEMDGIQVYPFPGNADYVVDNATPENERRYFTLLGLVDGGDVVQIKGLRVVAREETEGANVHYTSGRAAEIVKEPQEFQWRGYIQIPEGVRVTWTPTPGAAEYFVLLSAESYEQAESITLLTSGRAPWQTFKLQPDARALILNVDHDRFPYYALLCRNAQGDYLPISGLNHGRDDWNEVQQALFLDETLRRQAEDNLRGVLDNVRARVPEYAQGYAWDDLVREAEAANRWYPGHPLVQETLAFMQSYKERGENQAALAEVNRTLDRLAEHLASEEHPNYDWVRQAAAEVMQQHPGLERAYAILQQAVEQGGRRAEAEALVNQAGAVLEQGDRRAAVALLKQALELDPAIPNAQHVFNMHKRILDFEDLLDAVGADADKLAEMGQRQWANDNTDLAILAYDRAYHFSGHKDHLRGAVECRLDTNRTHAAVEKFSIEVNLKAPAGSALSHTDLKQMAVDLLARADELVRINAEMKELFDEERRLGSTWTDRNQVINNRRNELFKRQTETQDYIISQLQTALV